MSIKTVRYCDCCGNEIEGGNYYTLHDGRLVCASCFDTDKVQTCDYCGNYFLTADMYTDDNVSLCYNCRYDSYDECYECGDFVLNEDSLTRNGNVYCQECVPECAEDYIRQYHDNPSYEAKRLPGDNNKELFGFELEMGGLEYEDDLLTAARAVLNLADGDAWLCNDSSIRDYGFEFITHPMSLNYITSKLNLEGVLKEALDSGLLSHNIETCGLHVHVNRGHLGKTTIDQDLTTAKLLIIFSLFWDKIVSFSRRTYAQLDEWARYDAIDFDPQEDTVGTLCEKASEKRNYAERYRAINLCNRSTIEFRVFRGSLVLNTVMATLQFVYTVVNFAKKLDISNIQNLTWAKLVQSDFVELNSYLVERGLI